MAETDHKAKQRLRILIVDDIEDIATLFRTALQQAGYDALAVLSAPTALAAAQHEHFDLVIADIGMPSLNGFELAAQLRALPGYQDIPIISVTGFAEYDDPEQTLSAGFNELLRKPVDPQVLIETVSRLILTE